MRKLLSILVCCVSLCSIATADSFQRWFPWLYRYVNVAKTNVVSTDGFIGITQDNHNVWLTLDTNVLNAATNSWDWITANSNSIYYMYSRTSLWDQAAVDASLWTNWFATNAILSYVYAHTQGWDDAWSWVQSNSNIIDYVEAHSNEWDDAWAWVTGNSNDFDYVQARSNAWDEAYTWVSQNTNIVTITVSTTLDASYHTVLIDSSLNSVTASLPAAASVNAKTYNIKFVDDTNNGEVNPDGVETIDGDAANFGLLLHESITIQSDGSEWWIL